MQSEEYLETGRHRPEGKGDVELLDVVTLAYVGPWVPGHQRQPQREGRVGGQVDVRHRVQVWPIGHHTWSNNKAGRSGWGPGGCPIWGTGLANRLTGTFEQ